MNTNAIKELLYRLADDELVIGHRNSEWTGLGPILEEDIAFSSMAQDEIGHAQAYYMILHELFDEKSPDIIGFQRKPEAFRSCHLVEQPITDYAFSLMRHFLYDYAEAVRLRDLMGSTFRPLAELAKKLYREEKYHLLHAHTWIMQLGNATPESVDRMQRALEATFPMAFGMFEPTTFNKALAEDGVQSTEEILEERWLEEIKEILAKTKLKIPDLGDKTAFYGGRTGKHSKHLAPLLEEMTEVVAIDPSASW